MEALRDSDTHIGKIRYLDGFTIAKNVQSSGRSFRGASGDSKINLRYPLKSDIHVMASLWMPMKSYSKLSASDIEQLA